jgi:hypothetical protein
VSRQLPGPASPPSSSPGLTSAGRSATLACIFVLRVLPINFYASNFRIAIDISSQGASVPLRSLLGRLSARYCTRASSSTALASNRPHHPPRDKENSKSSGVSNPIGTTQSTFAGTTSTSHSRSGGLHLCRLAHLKFAKASALHETINPSSAEDTGACFTTYGFRPSHTAEHSCDNNR